MHHQVESTETGWLVARVAVLVVVFGTLAGFIVLSHTVSESRAGRIACIENQRATTQAVFAYQADHNGTTPRNLETLHADCMSRGAIPGRCPVCDSIHYYLDPVTDRVLCPNPAHRPGND